MITVIKSHISGYKIIAAGVKKNSFPIHPSDQSKLSSEAMILPTARRWTSNNLVLQCNAIQYGKSYDQHRIYWFRSYLKLFLNWRYVVLSVDKVIKLVADKEPISYSTMYSRQGLHLLTSHAFLVPFNSSIYFILNINEIQKVCILTARVWTNSRYAERAYVKL